MPRPRILLAVFFLVRVAAPAAELSVGEPVAFPLTATEVRVFQVPAAAGEAIRVSAWSVEASLTCTLRAGQEKIVQITSSGGTGGRASLSAYSPGPVVYTFEVKRAGKEPAVYASSAALESRRAASARDREEAEAYRLFSNARQPSEYDAALERATASANQELRLQIAGAKARALFGAGNYQEAFTLATAELPAARQLSHARLEGQLLYIAGLCQILLERNREAVQFFSDALPLQRAAGQAYETGATLQNLAAAHQVLGNCHESLAEAGEALEIRRKLGDEAREAFSLLAVAKAHLCLGDDQAALDRYQAVLPMWRHLADKRNEGASWNDMGVIYASLAAWDEARRAYQAAFSLRENVQDVAGEAETLVNLGQLQLLTHDYAGALTSFNRALALPRGSEYQRRVGYALAGRAEALYRSGRAGEFREPLRQSIDALKLVGDRSGESNGWRLLGEAEASESDFLKSISLAREVGDRPSEALSLIALARLDCRRGNWSAARASLESVLPMIESARAELENASLRMSYLSASREAYELYVETLVRLDPAGADPVLAVAAFEASERAHARTLLDSIGLSRSATGGLAAMEEVRAGALDGKTVLLEYLLGDERSWLWFVTATTLQRYELPGRAKLERLARGLYTALTARNVRDPSDTPAVRGARWKAADAEAVLAAARLRGALLSPVLGRIGQKRVVLVNDGLLHLIPFSVLGIAGEVVLAPSASVLVQSRRNAPAGAPRGLLILADPVFSASDERVHAAGDERLHAAGLPEQAAAYARLPLSRNEAKGISALLPASQVDERLDFRASPDALRTQAASRYAVIHIAAHTLLNIHSPERSGIVLSLVNAQGRPENGFLRLRDIYNLRLRAGLVTLSACQTAIGADVRGEGMIGLGYAFLYAGARRVVASLWEVEDGATAEFMETFYRYMYRENMTPATALHAAQLEIRRSPRWSSPYYWASFTIEGDWK